MSPGSELQLHTQTVHTEIERAHPQKQTNATAHNGHHDLEVLHDTFVWL